jgi:hypothetical protein
MRAEIEIEFRGKWINMPVEFDYSEQLGKAEIDTVIFNNQEILGQLDRNEVEYLARLAQKRITYRALGHKLADNERKEHLAKVRDEVLNDDVISRART